MSLEVTHSTLQLGSRDATTGWYNKNYVESPVEMLIITKDQQKQALDLGYWVNFDALGLTANPVSVYDKITDRFGRVWLIATVKPQIKADKLLGFICDLELLPLQNLTAKTYSESTVEDARHRTKVWLDEHLNAANLPYYIVAYGMPDYPMELVFDEKGIDVVFSVDTPETVPLPVGVGYSETVPIIISAVDKSNMPGTKLRWQAESQLRSVVETNPIGTLRTLTRISDNEQDLGGVKVYSVKYELCYKRYNV